MNSLDDPEIAAYRDAVLWTGVLLKLSSREAASVCRKVLIEDPDADVTTIVGLGLFMRDDDEGAVLAIPRRKPCIELVRAALRRAGLEPLASRLTKAARR